MQNRMEKDMHTEAETGGLWGCIEFGVCCCLSVGNEGMDHEMELR